MCNQIESLENILIQQIDVIANAEMDAWKEKEKAITVQYQQKKMYFSKRKKSFSLTILFLLLVKS